jgi:hypothetical protein
LIGFNEQTPSGEHRLLESLLLEHHDQKSELNNELNLKAITQRNLALFPDNGQLMLQIIRRAKNKKN